jgi:hypothetical protein
MGDGSSEAEEFWVVNDDDRRSESDSCMLSLFFLSSTNCGSSKGLSFGDMAVDFAG